MIIEQGTYDDFKHCVLYGWQETFVSLATELEAHFKGRLLDSYFANDEEGFQNTVRLLAPPKMSRHAAYLRLESYGFRKPVPMELAVTVVIPGCGDFDFVLEKSTPRIGKYFRYANKIEQLKMKQQERKNGSNRL